MDGVKNEEVRKRAGIERELASRVDQRVLSTRKDWMGIWKGHIWACGKNG